MGMAADELAVDGGQHICKVKMAGGAGDVGVEHHLHQDVAEFLGQRGPAAPVDGIQGFVAFLQEVAFQRFVGLFGIPGAAAGAAQARHDFHQRAELADAGFGDGGTVSVVGVAAAAVAGHRRAWPWATQQRAGAGLAPPPGSRGGCRPGRGGRRWGW